MSSFKRFSRLVVVLVVIGLVTTGSFPSAISADQGDVVKMSPGTYAHYLGNSTSIVKLDYPKSSILQNSIGDISLNITLTGERSSIAIYIPPEFTFPQRNTTNIWTSITNDYNDITITRLQSRDPIAPSWSRIGISNATIPKGSYVVRMFSVGAPSVCGRYFFKVFIDGQSIGSENFPTIVVKGGLDPAYVSGHVLNASQGKYGVPVNVPGKVIAEGRTALGRIVTAQAYFNASANGTYVLYGLPAGTYNLTASAAGFAPATVNGAFSVHAGQSLEGVDIYVYPSAKISGTIFSKCGPGPVPWDKVYNWTMGTTPIPRPISVEILDLIGQSRALVTGYTDPLLTYYSYSFNELIDLDGHVPQDYAGYVSGLESGDYYLRAYVNGYEQRDVIAIHVQNSTRGISVPFDLWRTAVLEVTVFFRDSEGGPPSNVTRGGLLRLEAFALDGTYEGWNSTLVYAGNYSLMVELTGILGSSRDYGLPSGTYTIQAHFSQYLQPDISIAILGEGCSKTRLSLDMVRGGIVELTLRSIDWQIPPLEVPWEYPNAPIRLEFIGALGQVYLALGTPRQPARDSTTVVRVTGLPPDTYLVRAYTVGYIQMRYYPVSVSIGGISDITIDLVKTARIQITLTFRKEGLIAPIDTYPYNHEKVPVRIEVYDTHGLFVGANTTYIPANESSPREPLVVVGFRNYAGDPCVRWVNYYDTTDGLKQDDYGLPPGEYLVRVWVPGYIQSDTTTTVSIGLGGVVGINLWLDRLAHIYGNIRGLNMYEDLIPLSWANATAYGPILTATTSLDGFYEMWVVNGTYMLAAASPGYETQGAEIHVSMAWEMSADFDLKPPGGTIPELSVAELTLPAILTVVCAVLYCKKSLSDSSLGRPPVAKSKPERATRA